MILWKSGAWEGLPSDTVEGSGARKEDHHRKKKHTLAAYDAWGGTGEA